MRSIFISLVLLLAGTDAHACSYLFPSAFEALNDLDMVFEGELHAVYVDDKQVSTELLSEYLRLGNRKVTIRYKVVPSKMYVGEQADIIELYDHYERGHSCSGPVFIGNLWGASLANHKLNVDDYTQYMAGEVRELLNALTRYQSSLLEARVSMPYNKLITRELETLRIILANELESLNAAFFSAPTELEALPINLLKARAEFLMIEQTFAKELTITTTAIALRS